MNFHETAFSELSKEQMEMVKRAIEIEQERHDLNVEQQRICRELGYQGINLGDEMRSLKG